MRRDRSGCGRVHHYTYVDYSVLIWQEVCDQQLIQRIHPQRFLSQSTSSKAIRYEISSAHALSGKMRQRKMVVVSAVFSTEREGMYV